MEDTESTETPEDLAKSFFRLLVENTAEQFKLRAEVRQLELCQRLLALGLVGVVVAQIAVAFWLL